MASLSADFNDGYRVRKENDAVLTASYSAVGYTNCLTYDFIARVLIVRTDNHGDGGITLTPFSQLDRETLVTMRDKLIDLKGNPPELPPEAPMATAPVKKFNL